MTNDLGSGIREDDDDVDEEDIETDDMNNKAHVFPVSPATIIFQALMVLSSVYFAMLMTNWGDPYVL